MIDIDTGKEHNLKNIRQIGSPTEDDRVYIENAAYARIHEEDYAQRRAFIFMGHTECTQGKYATFIEAAIPAHNLEFTQNLPRWGTHAWSDIFREIKRSYENSIIVGWALDIKGFSPHMTAELEAVHREQFGGAHQVLFLMDSLEGEEYFYLNKGNRLLQKEGFYIYYSRDIYQMHPAEVTVEMPRRESFQVLPPTEDSSRGRYRENMQTKDGKTAGRKASSYAMAAAIALLAIIGGVGVAQGKISLSGMEKAIDAMSRGTGGETKQAEVLVGTQMQETTETIDGTQTGEEAQTWTETLDLIPVEEIPAGGVKTEEETQSGAEEKVQETKEDTQQEAERKEEKQEEKQEETQTSANAATQEYYVVEEGDTLTGICKKLYGSTGKVEEIVQLNQLEDSDDIRVGQKLRLP